MDESPTALQRRLDQARQHLVDAYQHARAAGYRPGSAEMAVLADAERRFQHARSLWQDVHRQDADPVRQHPGEPGQHPDVVIDLAPDEHRIDLDGSPPHATGRRLSEEGPGSR